MRRLLPLLLLAGVAMGQEAMDQAPCRMDGADCPGTYAGTPAPTGCTAGTVALFLGSPVRLNCDSGLTYDAATDTLTVGAVAAKNVTVSGLATPGSITVTPTGTTGATTYTYKLVARLADGTTTEAGAASTTAAGHATLSAINYNALSWAAVSGAASYDVYRTVGGATQGKIASATTALSLNDTGLAGGGETAPSTDRTGVVAADSLLLGQTPIVSPSAGTTVLGGDSSPTPVAQVLRSQSSRGGIDTNVAGANLTISPGPGTGNATTPALILAVPYKAASGTTQQSTSTYLTISESVGVQFGGTIVQFSASDDGTLGNTNRLNKTVYVSRATLGSKTKAIADASATGFATFTIADGATYGGEIIYSVVSTQGTAKQRLDGRARFSVTREGVTYTVAVNEMGTQTLAAAAGTLTGAIEIAATGGVVTMSANFNTSQTPDTFVINYRFDSTDLLTLTAL